MIFIVDDSELLRARLVKMLSEIDGVEIVGQASNAAEAIEGIRTLKPKIVILDIQMPGGSGLKVLKAIKKEKNPPLTLMLTNHSYPQYRKKCMQLGADFFLDKTKDFDNLLNMFTALAERLRKENLPGGSAL
ncbi:MAG: response regulator transcription factor [Pyrinomonadaceae bacterium]